ncbi:MAG: STAS domain-containing protein [Nitrospinaceae bacterium]|jgi:anti-sigma B factor antagonist|nr:STAS domain-containing protein [Nitrospina sp.]MBT5376472.1 STAS domain-containing protein [Nitrospinaceae bacterium]MBT5869081.1 STAS domain-containing protein [Nitrospinaceae bacterium]MBT6346421.1 STAS domain-containing protein [Nitrospina sp.]
MGIDLKLEKGEGAVTVAVCGEIDMSSSTQMRDALSPLFQNNNKVIVVDLSGVSYIDSSGIATLVEGLQWSHSSKNKFRLAALTPGVKDVFEIARLLTVFEVFDTKEQALTP